MEYVFDNSDANPRNPEHPPRRVPWGWRSSDEMADVWIQVMTRSDADRNRLAPDVRRKMATEDAIGCETLIAREPEYAALRDDAAALYMELGQPEQALIALSCRRAAAAGFGPCALQRGGGARRAGPGGRRIARVRGGDSPRPRLFARPQQSREPALRGAPHRRGARAFRTGGRDEPPQRRSAEQPWRGAARSGSGPRRRAPLWNGRSRCGPSIPKPISILPASARSRIAAKTRCGRLRSPRHKRRQPERPRCSAKSGSCCETCSGAKIRACETAPASRRCSSR